MLTQVLLAALCSSALAQEALVANEDLNPRFLFNTSNLSVSLNSVYAGLLAILGGLALLAGLAYLLFLLSGDTETGYSTGSSYSSAGGYSARSAMYSQVAAGLLVQMLLSSAAASPALVFTASDALGAGGVNRVGVDGSAVSRADVSATSSSGAFVSQPPADPASLSGYSAYPPYSSVPYPYPYPYPYTAYATAAPASSDETSRLFGNIGNALNPANLFTCPSGDTGCVVTKVAAAGFILAAIGLAAYLVYALVTGKLGSFNVGRSADSPYSAIWDKMSVLDWIAMAEEVYRKFDITSMECQQRLVCEVHQNENTWGSTARKMNDAFSYLQYLELLNLPSEARMLLDEYNDAANKGRTSQKTCDELYHGCDFSMKNLITKYNGSNAI